MIYTFRFYSIFLLMDLLFAYVGPGMGAGFIAIILGLVSSIFIFFFGVIYYPIKRFIKKLLKKNKVKKG